MIIEAIRDAAMPLAAVLPPVAWLPHRLVRTPDGRLDKPPCQGATSNNPASWFSLDNALSLLASNNDVAGVAFAITARIIALDFDHCRDPVTGEINDEVMQELERFNSYAYITPSASGIRIVGLNEAVNPIPGGKRVRYLPGGSKVEIFIGPTNHYNTFTANLIGDYRSLRNIYDETLDYLENLPGSQFDKIDRAPQANPDATTHIGSIRAALAVIPNTDRNWDWWSKIGMAAWRSSTGSPEGLEAWQAWSGKHECYDPAACEERWQHWFRSPPTKIGFGTLYHLARQARPLFVPPLAPPDRDGTDGETDRQPSPLPLVYFSDIHPNLDAADFVEGLLIEASMAVVYGESNCGKTFFMTDLGIHVAMGKPWRGREIELGGVIYCALEGSHGISNRVAAFRAHYKLDNLELPFAIIPSTIDMLNPAADTDRLIETIKIAAAAMLVPVRLVVIDTLSRALAGGNENAPNDMGALVTNTDKVRQATRAAVAYVHHSGKDTAKGARGHSLLRAATDTEIEVSRPDADFPSTAHVTKQREMEIEGAFSFRLEIVELGKNRRGKPVTSCVVVEADAPEGRDKTGTGQTKLPPNAIIGVRALKLAMSQASAKLPPLDDYPPNTWAAPVSRWKEEFFQLKSGSTDTQKHAFSRSEDTLLARNIITVRNGLVWFCQERNERDNDTGQTRDKRDKRDIPGSEG